MRIILLIGKGGTGKTTMAAATAVAAARSGLRTLVVSTDGAHSLGDAFGQPLGSDPTQVAPLLTAHEINVQARLDQKWSSVSSYLRELLEWAGADPLRAEELAVVPGLDELLALEQLSEHTQQPWDVIVVDCAPTAETVRLLALPSALEHYLDRILPSHRRMARAIAPLARRNGSLPPGAPEGFAETLLGLATEIESLHNVMTDPQITTIRLVTTPDEMVIAETRRAWTLLTTFDHQVDAVIVNRVMPCDEASSLVTRIRDEQQAQIAVIKATFAGLAYHEACLRPRGAIGVTDLNDLAAETYGERGPLVAGATSSPGVTFDQRSMLIPIRGVESSEVRIRRSPRSIQVTLGSFRRIVDLPERLRDRRTISAVVGPDGVRLEFETE